MLRASSSFTAHPGAGVYFTNQFTPARERERWQLLGFLRAAGVVQPPGLRPAVLAQTSARARVRQNRACMLVAWALDGWGCLRREVCSSLAAGAYAGVRPRFARCLTHRQ